MESASSLPDLFADAIEDFSAAIKIEPRFGDAWKRRGQAHGGMMEWHKALADIKQCIALSRDPKTRADCYLERGVIHQRLRDFRLAAEDLHVRHPICNPFPGFIVLPDCRSSH